VKKLGLFLLAILLLGAAIVVLPLIRHKSHPHSVTLTWHAPAESAKSPAVSYNVYRSTTESGASVKVASGVKALTYHDTAVNPGTTYFYVVRSVDSGGNESPSSEQIKVTVPED
jgi:fibronectin type 3 domain-containing protein